MISITTAFIVLFPPTLFFLLLFLDFYNYRKKFEKKLNKKKKNNIIKLYSDNYPFCGGNFVEQEDFIKKEKENAKTN